MKTPFAAKAALLLALAAFSILPGCGKKNDNNAGIIGGPVGFVPIGGFPGGGGVGGCATLSDPNTPVYLTFAGTLNAYSSGLKANLSLYGTGQNTGGYAAQYNRTNMFGDTINIYVSGQSAYAVTYLAAQTVASIVFFNGGQVCGLYIDANVYGGGYSGQGWTGNFGGGTIGLTRNGQWVTNQYGQILAL